PKDIPLPVVSPFDPRPPIEDLERPPIATPDRPPIASPPRIGNPGAGGIPVKPVNGNISQQRTVEFWFKAGGPELSPVLYRDGSFNNYFSIKVIEDQLVISTHRSDPRLHGLRDIIGGSVSDESTPIDVEIEIDIDTKAFHHFVLTFDDGLFTAYLDGEQVAQQSTDFVLVSPVLEEYTADETVLDPNVTDNHVLLAEQVSTRYAQSFEANAQAIADLSLIAHWSLDDVNATTGQNQDSVESTLDTSLVGQPEFDVLVKGDGAVRFDGIDDGLRVSDHAGTVGSSKNQYTIELWFQADTVEGRQVLYEQGGTINGFNLYLDGNQLTMGAWSYQFRQWLNQTVEAGKRYHAVLSFDNGVLSGYVNGQEIGQADTGFTTMPAHGGGIGIGYMNQQTRFSDTAGSGAGYHFQGTIDEVALYNFSAISPWVTDRYVNAVLPFAQWSLAETAGSKAGNLGALGSVVDGTYAGGTTLGAVALTADGDGAADFDGINDGVHLPNHAAINTSAHAQRTIALWFNADDLDGTQILYEEGGGTNGMNVYLDGDQLKMGAWAGGDRKWLAYDEVSVNTTYQVTLVFDNGTLTGYVNGQQIGQVNTGFTVLPVHGNAAAIGKSQGGTRLSDTVLVAGNTSYFNGTIDDVELYNAAIPADRISHFYTLQTRQNEVLMVPVLPIP
ncbi:MAG: LamG-like jellyroll fold domain-containing protein, partial [Leptolyngbyaceae cyanobacterium]